MIRSQLMVPLLAFLIAAPAAAQDALGRGDRLDRNTQRGSGGHNAPALRDNFRSRNLLITGDVAGGRGFRGSVGYEAEGDFRGDLGSDDLFYFRSGSALSDVRYQTYGYQYDAFRVGQDFGLVEYRRSASTHLSSTSLPVGYAAYGASRLDPADETDSAASLSPLMESRLQVDRMLTGASTASQYEVASQPTTVGQVFDREGKRKLAEFSSVRGLRLTDPAKNASAMGLTTYDLVRAAEDQQFGAGAASIGAPFGTRFEQLPIFALPAGGSTDSAQPPSVSPVSRQHDAILENVARLYAETGGAGLEAQPRVVQGLERDFEALRLQLGGPRLAEAGKGGSNLISSPPTNQPTARTTIRERMEAQFDPEAAAPNSPLDLRDFSTVLRHGAQLDTLTDADASRFSELMAGAEQKLRDGEYFHAERRFTRALRYTPGHPLARAGVAHAQLAAGLYLTSAMTLHNLLMNQPEMIDVRYAAGLLAPLERLEAGVAALREILAAENRPASDRPAAAFLLAYIGHQLSDADMVREGLEILRASNKDDALLSLLEHIWLGEAAEANPVEAPQPEPVEAPQK